MERGKFQRLVREFPEVGILSELEVCTAWYHRDNYWVEQTEIQVAKIDRNLLMRSLEHSEDLSSFSGDAVTFEKLWVVYRDGRITELTSRRPIYIEPQNLIRHTYVIEILAKLEDLEQIKYLIIVKIDSIYGPGCWHKREYTIYKLSKKWDLARETEKFSKRKVR